MIKFFRKIRHDLLSKGKTGKYLKYAIGEIVLVVIGILIALSINNWNQNRLNIETSNNFHLRISDELESISDRFDNDEKRAEKVVEYIGKTVEILKNGKLTESAKDTLNYTLQNFFQFVRFDGGLKTLQEMENTGQLDLIYNKDLKKQTLEYLAFLESVSKIYDQIAVQVNDTDFIDKYVTIIIGSDARNNKFEYEFSEMSNDKYLINKLGRYGFQWQAKQFFSNSLSKSSNDLKEAFLKELDK